MDDGKSSLIGRLLYESKMIFEDHFAALEDDSKKVGTRGGEIDFALLVDGLAAEREQGITIDVAYRFFTTEKRKFIVADTPGHEQYTRNMVTGASTADLAVILIDARKGVLTQTRRHSYLAALLGIRHIVLAVNKMDLVDYSQQVFNVIERRLPRVRASDQARCHHLHPRIRGRRRQCHDPQCAHAMVLRSRAAGASGNRGTARCGAGCGVSHAGAMGEPAECGIPRLCRTDCERRGAPRRCAARAALGAHQHRGARANGRWRGGRGDGRPSGDSDARR